MFPPHSTEPLDQSGWFRSPASPSTFFFPPARSIHEAGPRAPPGCGWWTALRAAPSASPRPVPPVAPILGERTTDFGVLPLVVIGDAPGRGCSPARRGWGRGDDGPLPDEFPVVSMFPPRLAGPEFVTVFPRPSSPTSPHPDRAREIPLTPFRGGSPSRPGRRPPGRAAVLLGE